MASAPLTLQKPENAYTRLPPAKQDRNEKNLGFMLLNWSGSDNKFCFERKSMEKSATQIG